MEITIAFGFGLIHGIAFSEHFRDSLVNYDPNKFVDILKLLLTVLFFNIGVDIGQLVFVFVTFGILYLIRTKVNPQEFAMKIHEKVVFYSSVAVAALGTLWTFERIYKSFFL